MKLWSFWILICPLTNPLVLSGEAGSSRETTRDRSLVTRDRSLVVALMVRDLGSVSGYVWVFTGAKKKGTCLLFKELTNVHLVLLLCLPIVHCWNSIYLWVALLVTLEVTFLFCVSISSPIATFFSNYPLYFKLRLWFFDLLESFRALKKDGMMGAALPLQFFLL